MGPRTAVLYASLPTGVAPVLWTGRPRHPASDWGRHVEPHDGASHLLEKAELEIVRRLPVPARRRRILELLLIHCGRAVARPRSILLIWICCWSTILVPRPSTRFPLNRSACNSWPDPGRPFWATGQEADMEEIACKAAGAPACEFKIKLGVPSK